MSFVSVSLGIKDITPQIYNSNSHEEKRITCNVNPSTNKAKQIK